MRAPQGGPAATRSPDIVPEGELLRQSVNLQAGNILFTSGALAITGAGAVTAKTVNTVDYVVGGAYATKAAATMPNLAGTIAQNNFGGWVFCIDVSGNLSSLFMAQAATLAGMQFPAIGPALTVLGWVRLNPTTASFIGNTTLLDAANTNAVYVNALQPLGFIVNVKPG